MSSRETKVPAIPVPTTDNLVDAVSAIKELLEVRQGISGNALDANVTYRDLVALNLAKDDNNTDTTEKKAVLPIYPYSVNDGYDPLTDLTPPPVPTNLTATSTQNAVLLSWDQTGYRNRAYSEIWSSRTSNIGDATLTGTSTSQFYNDVVGEGQVRWYWVRDVSKADVKGAFTSTSVKAQTGLDVEKLLKQLTGKITEEQLYNSLAQRISRSDPTTMTQDSVGARIYTTNVALAEESTVREDETGHLFAQYTVKIDAGGKVVGFGLASEGTLANGTTSSFAVRADKFYVAPTAGYSGGDVIPFIVDTTTGTVYMAQAMIKDASITNAKIQSLTASKLTAGYVAAVIGVNGAKVYGAELYAGGTTSTSTDANGNITGFTANNPTVAISGGNATFVADSFKVKSSSTAAGSAAPFEVVSGNVYMSVAYIRDGSIASAKIGDGEITNAKINNDIQSNDFSSGSSGWRIRKSGEAEFNNATFRGNLNVKSSSSGARTEINNSVIKVYDSNGVLRVKLGDLNA